MSHTEAEKCELRRKRENQGNKQRCVTDRDNQVNLYLKCYVIMLLYYALFDSTFETHYHLKVSTGGRKSFSIGLT